MRIILRTHVENCIIYMLLVQYVLYNVLDSSIMSTTSLVYLTGFIKLTNNEKKNQNSQYFIYLAAIVSVLTISLGCEGITADY